MTMETYLKGFLVPPGWWTFRQLPWTPENTPEVSEQVGESQGAGARRQAGTSRAGNFQRALAVCHVPVAQETPQQADAAMEIRGLQFPTLPLRVLDQSPGSDFLFFSGEIVCFQIQNTTSKRVVTGGWRFTLGNVLLLTSSELPTNPLTQG